MNAKLPKAKLKLCAPRGFCAGVERAIEIVVLALKKYGAPVYVRHEIVHNKYVVEGLENRGAVFVETLNEVPDTKRPVIFSAHGVPKAVVQEAQEKNMFALDATCPLVSKVHKQALSHHRKGRHVILVGHRGHPEVVGTMGQLPNEEVSLVETLIDAQQFKPPKQQELGYVTQTTLSVDDTKEIIQCLNERFPELVAPHAESICYATTNRQAAVRHAAPKTDIFLIVGAPNSSNSMRLVEVAKRAGAQYASLVQNNAEIKWNEMPNEIFKKNNLTIGLSAGASAPESLVQGIIECCRDKFNLTVELADYVKETEEFPVLRELRDTPLTAADMEFLNG